MTLFVFDLDGTLIDSKRDIVLSANRALLQLGFPAMPEEIVGKEIGRGPAYLFTRLLGAQTPRETIQELASRFKEIYGRHLLDHTQVYPGVLNVLSRDHSRPKVIVTNKSQAFADQIVDAVGLRRHFEGVFGAEAFATQKPDPGPVLEVCRIPVVAPSE